MAHDPLLVAIVSILSGISFNSWAPEFLKVLYVRKCLHREVQLDKVVLPRLNVRIPVYHCVVQEWWDLEPIERFRICGFGLCLRGLLIAVWHCLGLWLSGTPVAVYAAGQAATAVLWLVWHFVPGKTGPISTDMLGLVAWALRRRDIECEMAIHKLGEEAEILPPVVVAAILAINMPVFVNMIIRAIQALGIGH